LKVIGDVVVSLVVDMVNLDDVVVGVEVVVVTNVKAIEDMVLLLNEVIVVVDIVEV